ncbi:ComEC/Rec2 family competence protein [Geochorda subterranea]|uniref:ComEC/Rec2 family competence protein n=1 Tax=Geochorda subterranea TaxID=3109564 RepID=A0ABZ1BL62_9FIRM|nr:ComEC/Rec2 family competence protein [Limnochorda sp. LNt]WRP13554.1 ComEC/Rec2 family competence protein [Limnochorda sp. LNt]
MEVAVPAGDRRGRSWRPGMWVAARGLVRRPETGAFPGDFSLRRYLGARGVGLVVEVRSESRLAVPAEPPRAPATIRLRAAVAAMGETMARRLETRLGPQGAAWARAVVLGHRDALAEADEQALWEAGLGHVLSVSGLHVGLLAGPLVAVVRRLPRSRWVARLGAAIVACATGWAYAGMTGLAPPAVRAGLMQSLGMALWMAGRRSSLATILGVAAAAQMLLSSPGLGADAGFQMSYLATLAIALFLGRPRAGRAPPGPVDARARRRALRRVTGRMLEALGLSLAAWAAITPLTALYFGRVSLLGAVVSVGAGPVCGLLLWSALAAALVPSSLAGPAVWVAERTAGTLRALALAGAHLEGGWGAAGQRGGVEPASRGGPGMARRAAGATGAGRDGPGRRGDLAGAALAAGLPGASQSPAAVTAAPVGTGWVVAGRSPGGDGWLWIDARPGQELGQALEKAAAALSGLGVARARVALWSASSTTSAELPGLSPKEAAMSRAWLAVGEQGPVVLGSTTHHPVSEVHASSIRLRVEGRTSLRLEMEGAGSVLLDVDTHCLAWESAGIRHCRGDGPVHLTQR